MSDVMERNVEVKSRLAPMFNARSMVVLGASGREGSFGQRLAQSVTSAKFAGRIDFINPRQSEILGRPCHASLADIDDVPDLAILGMGARNLEAAMLSAIDRGVRAAVIFDACYGETASGLPLLPRLRDIAREARLPVCGGAGMGFINVATGCVASFYPAGHLKPGGISLIAHSGSVFTTLAMNDPRYRFDLIISSGQEIGATVDEYIDYAVQRSTTRVIAVFMEAARNPAGFMASLRRARAAGVPVVVCKVGRSAESARMARSHTGALAGSRVAYEAAIDDCGAIVVDNVDQLMNVAQLCAAGRLPGAGGVGLVTDSGGLRELVMDCAGELGAPLATLSADTVAALRATMPPSLEPSNPLDCAADLTDEYARVFERGLAVLGRAPEVSMIGLEADLRDDYIYLEDIKQLALTLPKISGKPCFFYTSFARTHNRQLGEALAEHNVPCINGAAEMLTAVKKLQAWADRVAKPALKATAPRQHFSAIVADWRASLRPGHNADEREALDLLARAGIPTIRSETVDDRQNLAKVAARIGYPIVLKTAAQGIEHKSDLNGVRLNLGDEAALLAAYDDISARLGSRVIVQSMANPGVEMAIGCVHDADFGPLVMISAGGALVELFDDRQFALAPVSLEKAEQMIAGLPISKLLAGARGAGPKDVKALAHALVTFSELCVSLGDKLAEMDVNPVIVSETGVVAVDALFVAQGDK
ncbi:acyl-CoA synthetase (NDP forming) [Dongia mobilis]|uniref:Acyl-CoA synthetase (NDP forming) n=1 Tax=Dongia mobilis TaxID=578943 RepID=A0A4R6WJ21_9PROT|nr:acetate--CoA ligase family protein [Dongia mobilis]TDQ78434.1 acyl-CoA synthetase (NDP forming) [Dongia mobilis]